MQPRQESRIESLEKRASTIEATLIEMSSDQAEELKAIRQAIDTKFTEHKHDMSTSFNQIGDLFDRNFESFEDIKQDIASFKDTVNERFDKLEGLIMQLLQQKSGE